VGSLDCLFVLVDPSDSLWVVNLLVQLLEPSLVGVHSPEVRRAPHLIGVKLVRASELIAIFLRVHAVKKTVPCLETEFSVELISMEVSDQVKFIVA